MNGVERLRQKLSRYGFILRSIRVKGKILYNVADQISGSSINDYGMVFRMATRKFFRLNKKIPFRRNIIKKSAAHQHNFFTRFFSTPLVKIKIAL